MDVKEDFEQITGEEITPEKIASLQETGTALRVPPERKHQVGASLVTSYQHWRYLIHRKFQVRILSYFQHILYVSALTISGEEAV